MKRTGAAAAVLAGAMFFAGIAHAAIPDSQSLQPLPPQAHADVSQSVNRTATPQDEETIAQSEAVNPGNPPESSDASSSGMSAAEILLILSALVLVVAGVWQAVKSSQ